MDDILGNDIDDEMSKYVLNPSKHSSISLNEGAKVLNRSGSSSSSSRMDQELSNYVLDPSKHSSISLNGGSTVYNRTESSNSVNITSTPFSNDINSKKKGDHLSKALSFDLGDLTEEELTLNMNLTQETRASSVDSDVIEILSPPPQSSQPTLSNRAKSPPIFSSQPLLPKSPPADVVALDEDDDDILDFFPQSQARSQTIKEDTFHFTFIDTEGNQVRHLSQAAVSVDTSENCVMYRLQFYTSQRQHDNAPPIKDVEVDHEDREYAFAYISEKDIKSAICPGLPARPVLELHHDDDNQTNDFWPPDSSQSRVDVIRKKKHPSQTITSSQTSTSSSQIDSSQNMFSQPMVPASSQKTSSSQTSSISGSQPVPVSQLVAESETTISYSPDEYEILLVLDSREIQMQKDRQYFQRLLKIKGINVITRSLDLGDVIWVARKKGHENPADELYLDFVVERKRLDDLVSSIKDGRFNEQKGRLKRSCSRKVIYIIEEYDRESANQFSAQAIQTAMSSTQIVDGFFLKHTNSPEETIDYLVLLTRKIEQIYRNTTLHVIPEHIITRQNFISLKNAYQERAAESDKAYLITYPLYSDLNKKTGSTTLHDIYMRMLMTIRGINAERALTLMKIYPTPAALLQVLSGKTAEQGKTLAKDATKDQIARRKWNTSTSEKLYEIWGTAVYPDDEGSDDPDS
jgi:ERCC4-type nuclease